MNFNLCVKKEIKYFEYTMWNYRGGRWAKKVRRTFCCKYKQNKMNDDGK